MSTSEKDSERFRRFWRSFGPAIIVACVVLGPGSILTSSKIGCQFGYQMEWVLVGAGLLMVGTIATGMRIGVSLEHSPCRELASRLGRPVALLAGVTVFLMASCFQFSNNLGVLASVEPLFDVSNTGRIVLLVGLNGLLIAGLFGLQKLYVPVERLMMILMGLMLLGFAANLVRANPNGFAVLLGLVPSLPEQLVGSFLPRVEHVADMGNPTADGPKLIDPWITLQGLIVTTFSIGFFDRRCFLSGLPGERERLDAWSAWSRPDRLDCRHRDFGWYYDDGYDYCRVGARRKCETC